MKDLQTYVFEDCKKLKTVKLPDGIKKIGECLFMGCESLTSVVVPPTVTEIGERAYYDCKSLSSVTLPALTSLVIPSTVMEMGTWAFFCHKLAKVTLPARFNDADVLVDVFDNSSTKLFGTSEATLLKGFTFK